MPMTLKCILLRSVAYCVWGISLMLLALFGLFWCKKIYDCAYGLATAGWVGLLDALWKYMLRPIPYDPHSGTWAFESTPSSRTISLRYLLMLAITYGLWRINRRALRHTLHEVLLDFRYLLRDKPKAN